MSSLKVMPCLFFMGHFINFSDELAFSKFLLLLLVFLFNQEWKWEEKKSRNSPRCSFPNSMRCLCLLGFGFVSSSSLRLQ